eukprot:4255494-Amphidinium_carterae.1
MSGVWETIHSGEFAERVLLSYRARAWIMRMAIIACTSHDERREAMARADAPPSKLQAIREVSISSQ